MIACESEELAGACCNVVDTAEDGHYGRDRCKGRGSGHRLCGVIHDLDVGLACYSSYNTLNVSEAETKRDEHEEAQGAVNDGSPDHSAWKGF